jgi:hypothetical protein
MRHHERQYGQVEVARAASVIFGMFAYKWSRRSVLRLNPSWMRSMRDAGELGDVHVKSMVPATMCPMTGRKNGHLLARIF